MSESASTPLSFGKNAIFLGAILLALYGLIVFSATRNASQRSVLEIASQPSAVEERTLYSPPDNLQPGAELVAFQGRKLVADLADDIKLDDSAMRLAGRTDDKSFPVYRCLEPAQKDFLFLKIKTGKYQRLR